MAVLRCPWMDGMPQGAKDGGVAVSTRESRQGCRSYECAVTVGAASLPRFFLRCTLVVQYYPELW